MKRVLYVDLSSLTFEIKDRKDLSHFMGGTGLGCQLLSEEVHLDKDPLDPQQPIIFARGTLAPYFPSATQVAAVFRSPLTGYLGESFAGGSLAAAMFLANLNALVIKGRADRPVRLTVGPRIVHIKKTDPLYGTGTEECLRELYDLEPSPGLRSLVVIGQAGEKTIRFADLVVDRYWRFGGSGAGAIFGSKNLKSLMVYGDRNLPIPDVNVAGYREVFENLHNRLVHSELMPLLHNLGTAVNLEKMQALMALPSRNSLLSRFDGLPSFTAQSLGEKHLVRQLSCTGCPIGCVHVGHYRRMSGSDSLEYEESHLPYDFATVYALGSQLGLETPDDFWAVWEKVSGYGLDPLASGAALGWLTEAYEQGLVTDRETGTPVAFGYVEGYLHALDGLVGGETPLYQDLALGATTAADRWGGRDYVTVINRRATTGLHTGYDSFLSLALGFQQPEFVHPLPSRSNQEPNRTINNLIARQAANCLSNSLGICRFINQVYDLKTVSRALKTLGYKLSLRQLRTRSYDLYYLQQGLNRRMGLDPARVTVPSRLFSIPTAEGILEQNRFAEMLDIFAKQSWGKEKEGVSFG
jgi:aldehyde:ferredoxin oxidoreductase